MTEPGIRAGETVAGAEAGEHGSGQTAGQTRATPESDELTALRERAERAERESALRRALGGIDWFEPDDAMRELASLAHRNERGEWEVAVTGAAGETRATLDEAARQLAARKPHWVRARVVGGSGANGGEGSAAGAPAGLSYADLLKPEHAERLREYIHNRPRELERMRQAHFG